MSALDALTFTDILGGLITALILYLLKRQNDMEKTISSRLAAMEELMRVHSEEIERLRDRRSGPR